MESVFCLSLKFRFRFDRENEFSFVEGAVRGGTKLFRMKASEATPTHGRSYFHFQFHHRKMCTLNFTFSSLLMSLSPSILQFFSPLIGRYAVTWG